MARALVHYVHDSTWRWSAVLWLCARGRFSSSYVYSPPTTMILLGQHITGAAPDTVRFAPVKLRLNALGLVATRKQLSHLALVLRGTPPSRVLISWTLLTSGDIETNPGPPRRWKYPCTVCSAPVKSNQRGIQCDRCDLWTHASCGGVGQEEYEELYGDWFCPTCVLSDLPFASAAYLVTLSYP